MRSDATTQRGHERSGGDDVDARRRAVAEADTLVALLAAHRDVEMFLHTPYGAAYLAHREGVYGWDRARIVAELEELAAQIRPERPAGQ